MGIENLNSTMERKRNEVKDEFSYLVVEKRQNERGRESTIVEKLRNSLENNSI